ncbi:NAD-dependent epimerase/dehydratase family protein [Maribellus mangrovi]|uniref:NAD-dependent epimerase/dehydratase family protein n=1 Tax=Maribellus mangrovi TaxID=3133146 RepID=UPI0030ED4C69
MKTIDKKKPFLVTGATGYVAGWLVKKLLEEGLTVHAAVRNPDNKEKVKYLDEIAAKAKGKIIYFKSDLLDEGSYAEAMKDCELVFHTASPFTTEVKDPQKELIDPAKLGTRNVLEQVNKTSSVKRVVLTSSCAAIYGDNADLEDTPNGIFTEEIWNTSSSLKHQPYSYSKTVAEREAWQIVKEQNRWDVVVINPVLVLGPAINPNGVTSESFNIVKQFGNGSMKAGAPDIGMGAVDVRDAALAHFKAGFTPEASGRYIISGHDSSFLEMAAILLPKYGDKYPIPKKAMPKWLIWLLGPAINKAVTRKYVSRNVGLPFKGDNSKSKKELGMDYMPLEQSMNDMFQQMIDNKVF